MCQPRRIYPPPSSVQAHPDGFVISCQVSFLQLPAYISLTRHQDLSTNGTLLNGNRIRKTSVILMDGDTIEIPSSQSANFIHAHLARFDAVRRVPMRIFFQDRQGENAYIRTNASNRDSSKGIVFACIDEHPSNGGRRLSESIQSRRTALGVEALPQSILLWTGSVIARLLVRPSRQRRNVK